MEDNRHDDHSMRESLKLHFRRSMSSKKILTPKVRDKIRKNLLQTGNSKKFFIVFEFICDKKESFLNTNDLLSMIKMLFKRTSVQQAHIVAQKHHTIMLEVMIDCLCSRKSRPVSRHPYRIKRQALTSLCDTERI